MKSLPIACTLTPSDLQERLALIRKLTAEALLGHDRNGLVLALRYAPEAVERVRAMVVSEQHCCAFLNFEVREQPDAVHVRITAPENARDAADELFEQFISSPPDSTTVDEHRGIQRTTPLSERVDCDRTVIDGAQNPEEHRGLRTHITW